MPWGGGNGPFEVRLVGTSMRRNGELQGFLGWELVPLLHQYSWPSGPCINQLQIENILYKNVTLLLMTVRPMMVALYEHVHTFFLS